MSSMGKELEEVGGCCSICGYDNKIVHQNSDSKLICEDCNKKAVTSVILIEDIGKDDDCGTSDMTNSNQLDELEQEDEWEGASEEGASCEEDDGEYELTVTEEALLHLHGLSLKLPIPCDLCPPGTVFDDLDEFDAHMGDHPEAKMFACQLCSNTYKSWSNLVAHRKVFHHGEVLSCVECGSRRSHARLEGAVHFPVEGKPHGCEECNVGLDTVSEVYRHYWHHTAPPGSGRLERVVTRVGRPPKKSICSSEQTANGRLVDKIMDTVENSISSPDDQNIDPASESGRIVSQQISFSRHHKHTCPHCLFSSSSLEDYRNHISSNAKVHGCTTCVRPLSKKMTSTDHEYCHLRPQQYDCVPCARILESEESFDAHIKSEHGGSRSKDLLCCTCGKKQDPSVFVEHTKACRRKQAEWEVKRRLERKTCQSCGKVFRRAGALRRHVQLHEMGRRKQRDCLSCGRSFRHGGAYAKHIWANPDHVSMDAGATEPGGSGSANFVCEYCGRTFVKRDGLKIHLMRHSGVKPHACPSCPKAFLSRTSLSVHVRQHTGERPYMCEICGKNFTGPTSLYVHQRTHRLQSAREKEESAGATRHTCPVCGKVLSSKLVFEGHVRQHTGERPFTCTTCGKGFTTLKIMKMHSKRHEKGTVLRKVGWVEEMPEDGGEGDTLGGDSSAGACIFLCPKCGVGLLSPEELEGHMAGGECSGGGSEMFVLPMNSDVGCMVTGSMVELLANPSTTEIVDG